MKASTEAQLVRFVCYIEGKGSKPRLWNILYKARRCTSVMIVTGYKLVKGIIRLCIYRRWNVYRDNRSVAVYLGPVYLTV